MVDSFAPLKPTADRFRDYLRGAQHLSPEELLLGLGAITDVYGAEMMGWMGPLTAACARIEVAKANLRGTIHERG